ncbi:hypothetical protein WJX75_002090 [Coccomyxa subellipsoidea]|uniref:UBC core domain-containing protein n=1 Tax=Coccomyxa subellipsoidea TaxID=248742 RepID=A0ABR2YDQ8_9CHLO
MTARTRLVKELKELSRTHATDTNYHRAQGPNGTPYQGGVFQLNIRVPDQYPLVPPTVQYHTRIFHSNVHFKTGEICLDILKNAWSPAWTLQSTCQAIVALMSDAAPDSPLNCDAGNLLRAGDMLRSSWQPAL